MGQGRTLLRKIKPQALATALKKAKPHLHSKQRKTKRVNQEEK